MADGTQAVDDPPDLDQVHSREPLAASPFGQFVLSMFVMILVAVMVLSNLPTESHISEASRPLVRPVTDVTGLTQNWNLFAPNPAVRSSRLRAVVVYSDGTQRSWLPPQGDPFVGTYSTWRWRKFTAGVMSAKSGSRLQPDMAAWIARNSQRDGEYPVRVTLLRGRYKAPAPGSGLPKRSPEWTEEVIHVANFDPEVGP